MEKGILSGQLFYNAIDKNMAQKFTTFPAVLIIFPAWKMCFNLNVLILCR